MAEESDYTRASNELFRTWEKAMGAWWDEVLETPAFLGAVNAGMGANSKARGAYTAAVDKVLEQAHVPTRNDLIRVARIASLLEDRLLAQEDLLLDLRERLATAEKEALKARVEAAETRLELGSKLDLLLRRVEALGGPDASSESSAPSDEGADTSAAARRTRRGGR
jgi:hypothetical protein